MSTKPKKILYSIAIAAGLSAGAFGIAGAATSQATPPPATASAAATEAPKAAEAPGAPEAAEKNSPENPNEASMPGGGHPDAAGQQDHQFDGVE